MNAYISKSFKVIAIGTVLSWQLFAFGQTTSAAGSSSHSLNLTENSSSMNYNGQTIKANQPVTQKGDRAYVPLKSIAQLYGFSLSYDAETKETIAMKDSVTLRFTPDTKNIDVNGSAVTSAGIIYAQKGSLMVPLRTWAALTDSKLSASGTSYTLSWNTGPESHSAPVADFLTDKTVYRMGENIRYEDRSHDENSEIVKRTWTGKAPAFFETGEHQITLEVENKHGLTHSVTKTVSVTDEILYSPEEHGLLFTPPGSKIAVQNYDVLGYEQVTYNAISNPMTFVRSNSPEHLYGEEGIGYQDKLTGDFRINIHNQNRSQKELSVYLLATNHGTDEANVTLKSFGMGGPTKYVSTSGKTAVSRFLESLTISEPVNSFKVPAGETAIVLPDISKVTLKPGLTMTSYSEFHTDQEIEFSVVILDPDKEPITSLPQLSYLERDGRHVRGTFPQGNRSLEISGTLGEKPQRIIIGDDNNDEFVVGEDRITGNEERNIGNTGVLYSTQIKVAPRTVIALNARGGHYAGAFLVNGKVVNMTEESILINPEEAGVLYRTGNKEETVQISFVLASGSNLPIHMVFLPMPDAKE